MNRSIQSRVVELCGELVARPSVTPDDAGCQRLIAERLLPRFYCGEVTNVLFTRGLGSPSLWFLGHTDVVPPGPEDLWTHPPFSAEDRDGMLFGRGVADMKGAVAAMVVALEAFLKHNPDPGRGQLGLLLTSDEEGEATDGIVRVAEELAAAGQAPDYCVVGEPSSLSRLGDSVRIGRRGSIHVRLRVRGIQGHTAFPQHLDNPVHRLAPFLNELVQTVWDRGTAEFPATSAQVASIQAGTGARNVTPADLLLLLNIRHCPETSSGKVKSWLESSLKRHGIENFDLDWQVSGEPFYSMPGKLREATIEACRDILGMEPDLNTGGGTSDGRFIAPLGTEVLELGLVNSSIHKIDECTPIADLGRLSDVYHDIIRRIFLP